MSSLTGKQIEEDGTLSLRCASGPPAPTKYRLAIEGSCIDADGAKIAVMLHVDKGGLMACLRFSGTMAPRSLIRRPLVIWRLGVLDSSTSSRNSRADFGTLQASAANCSGNLLVKTGSVYICAIDYAPYQPTRWSTRTIRPRAHGRRHGRIAIGARPGEQHTDGDETRITSSNGLSVPFVHDTPARYANYTYDAAGNVASLSSSNANGASVAHTYENLNRLTR